jgi:hypothetical protein
MTSDTAFSFESNGLLSNPSLSSRESDVTGVRFEDEHSVAASSNAFTPSRLLGESHFLYLFYVRRICMDANI